MRDTPEIEYEYYINQFFTLFPKIFQPHVHLEVKPL